MIRADLRADRQCCYGCSAPLAEGAVVSRSWSKVRSGEWIGSHGEYVTIRCSECGRKARLLWTVNMAPRQDRAA